MRPSAPSQVVAPTDLSEDHPVFFLMTVSRGVSEWTVERRYSAFDALQTELFFRRLGKPRIAADFPAKHPPPKRDAKKLAQRAAALEAWAAAVLEHDDCLGLACVITFFGLAEPPLSFTGASGDLDQAAVALASLQSIQRDSFLGVSLDATEPSRGGSARARRAAVLALVVGMSLGLVGLALAPEVPAPLASMAAAGPTPDGGALTMVPAAARALLESVPAPSAMVMSLAAAAASYNPFAAAAAPPPPPPPPKKRLVPLAKPLKAVGKWAKAVTRPVWAPFQPKLRAAAA